MAIDPAAGFPHTAAGRTTDKLADLERRVKNLEQGNPTIAAGTGAPSSAPRDGTPFAQTDTPRLWLYVGGAWRFTTLT